LVEKTEVIRERPLNLPVYVPQTCVQLTVSQFFQHVMVGLDRPQGNCINIDGNRL